MKEQDPATVQVALGGWETDTLLLPPITSVTFYSGSPPLGFLRQRIAGLLDMNPWLAARMVKKGVQGGGPALRHTREAAADVERHFTVFEPDQVRLDTDMDYSSLLEVLSPLQTSGSSQAFDADELLFKVAVVPVEAGTATADTPLIRQVSTPGYALIVSMNHTIGDGYVYYRVYDMLAPDTPLEALDPVRIAGFERAAADVLGEPESAMLESASIMAGIVKTYAWGKLTRRPTPDVCLNTVDPDWISAEKEAAKREGTVPFVSSNDAITSWFLRETGSTVNLMALNLRGRDPAGLEVSESLAGNYGIDVPYFPEDVRTPTLIRQSLRAPDGGFRAHRAADPPTRIPSSWELLQNRTSFITSWAGFYRDLQLPTGGGVRGAERQRPQLHLPIMAPEELGTLDVHTAIVFSPREGELALMTVSRLFDRQGLLERRRLHGSESPLDTRLI